MASETSLVTSSANPFPIKYVTEINCSEDTLQKKIDEVASFVANVYAKFLTMDIEERKELRKQGFWISEKALLPSSLECKQFEVELKKRIITELNQKNTNKFCSVDLSTDYSPEGVLDEVAKSVFLQKDEGYRLFPQKTKTTITLNKKVILLHLNIDFRGPGL